MNKADLCASVQSYLDGTNRNIELTLDENMSAVERFQMRTAKRLKNAVDHYHCRRCGLNDVMLALRDYLIVFQARIPITQIQIPADNQFGINFDEQTQCYYASFQFPQYVNDSFVEQAFLQDLHPPRNNKNYDLRTDPFICGITGFNSFKSIAQKLAVYGALNTPDSYTALVSLPTGGGKSLVTQTLAYQREGLTIVVVPTISLAIDQVRAAKQIIKSESIEEEIFYYCSGVDQTPILNAIQRKKAKMLFISPEALINNPKFLDVVKSANSLRYLKNIVIDEAHIVVDWGASFRVDYQCLESWRRKLVQSNPSIRTILLSATYEKRCVAILKDFFSQDQKWIEIRCDSLRHEPRYMLVEAKSYTEKMKKMVRLVETMPHPMIIYVARPSDADDIKKRLMETGIQNVQTFTGLTDGLRRKALIDGWVNDEFEIMVATSAFGVGVDKNDVRTVLHMYIPPNPNAYYQELGRGGRDKLPCLSIMCTYPDDLQISFQRITKKVMTSEKIIGRWNSMYDSPLSKRIDADVLLDTSVKPNYASQDEWDDTPTSDADMNWNIYVILLLRRFGLIKIHDVISRFGKHIFDVEIQNDALRVNNDDQKALIERIRLEEWDYYDQSYKLMKSAILNSSRNCWSEMFFETYEKVSEYCAGCPAHTKPVQGDFLEFPLKQSIKEPLKKFAEDQLALFKGANECILFSREKEEQKTILALIRKRISVLVTESLIGVDQYTSDSSKNQELLVLNFLTLRELVKKKSYYYISGIVAVMYRGDSHQIYEQLRYIMNNLSKNKGIKLIHVFDENVYFDWMGKTVSDLINGPALQIDDICPLE